VGELDDRPGLGHLGRCGVTELGRQRHQERPEPLAARLDQVPGGLAQDRVGRVDGLAQVGLHGHQAGPHRLLERGIVERDADRGAGGGQGTAGAGGGAAAHHASTMPHAPDESRHAL
jgi:hypothetical protein